MFQDYKRPVDHSLLQSLIAARSWEPAFEELARPLHEALYHSGTFDVLAEWTPPERLILCLDYIQMQVGQGGFIQLIQNGYISLLVTAIEAAQDLDLLPELQKLFDDVLKVYVLNHDALSRDASPQEFAKLYAEFQEFDPLDAAFSDLLPGVLQTVVSRVVTSAA